MAATIAVLSSCWLQQFCFHHRELNDTLEDSSEGEVTIHSAQTESSK